MDTIFLPHLSLALEYQGQQHYYSGKYFGNSSISQRRDQSKVKFAGQFGITVIAIPFWWDTSSSSLAGTIQSYRPDIHLETKEKATIPLEMPVKFRKKYTT
jgi:hypothetical protein